MEVFVRNLISFLLQTVWAMHLFFNKFHAIPRCDGEELTTTTKTPAKVSNTTKTPRISISSNLLFNLGKNSVINLSDVITPDEEEMLRCMCAKGYTRSHRRKKLENIREACIPRDTFTNIWIDSCCTV